MTISRRGLLGGAAAGLVLPVLESVVKPAWAQVSSGSLKRIIFYTFHNAWYEDVVFPRSTSYQVGPEGVRYIPLAQLTGDVSQLFTAAKYGALKSKMNIMRGFDLLSLSEGGGGHRALYALGASDERSSQATRDTIDTVISNSPRFYPTTPFRRTLNATPVSDSGSGYNFSFQGGQPRSQLRGPSRIFTEFFSGALPGAMTPPTPADPDQARRLATGATVKQLEALARSPRLSMADQRKLAEHAAILNGLLPSLAPSMGQGGGVTACSRPTLQTGINESINATSGAGQRLRMVMDEVFMALSCQLTNMVTLQPVNADDSGTLVTDGGSNDVYHGLAGHHHDVPRYLTAKTWIFDQLLYLLNRMSSTVESNGLSMLDNSLVVVLSNDGCGIHSSWDMPVVTFGSLGGLIKTGNYINFQRPNAPQLRGSLDLINAPDALGNYRYDYLFNLGRPLGALYTTLLNVLQIPHTGFGEYHDPSSAYTALTSASAKQASLPVLT